MKLRQYVNRLRPNTLTLKYRIIGKSIQILSFCVQMLNDVFFAKSVTLSLILHYTVRKRRSAAFDWKN